MMGEELRRGFTVAPCTAVVVLVVLRSWGLERCACFTSSLCATVGYRHGCWKYEIPYHREKGSPLLGVQNLRVH